MEDLLNSEEFKEIGGELELTSFMMGLLSGLRKAGVLSDEDVAVVYEEQQIAKKHMTGFLQAAVMMEEVEDTEDVEQARECCLLLKQSIEGLADMVGPVAVESDAFQQFTGHFDVLMKDLKDL